MSCVSSLAPTIYVLCSEICNSCSLVSRCTVICNNDLSVFSPCVLYSEGYSFNFRYYLLISYLNMSGVRFIIIQMNEAASFDEYYYTEVDINFITFGHLTLAL